MRIQEVSQSLIPSLLLTALQSLPMLAYPFFLTFCFADLLTEKAHPLTWVADILIQSPPEHPKVPHRQTDLHYLSVT